MFTFLFFQTIKKLEKILIIRDSDFKAKQAFTSKLAHVFNSTWINDKISI